MKETVVRRTNLIVIQPKINGEAKEGVKRNLRGLTEMILLPSLLKT
jgi:hypothetical protein